MTHHEGIHGLIQSTRR